MSNDNEFSGNVLKLIFAISLSYVLLFTGCTTISKVTDIIKDYRDQNSESAKLEANDDDALKFSELNFTWGGFHAEGATSDGTAVIADLNIKSNGMSYRWVTGGCEQLGASDRTSADSTLACLFCKIDGKWVGGKFDWISTSRVTRDFHNIETSYNGWDKDAISKATEYRFVIISKDGRKRTNVISAGR